MTTPTLEDRVTILETRLDAVLPTVATKADIAEIKTDMARLEGKVDAMEARLEGKMDAMNERQEGRIDRLEEKMDAKMDALGNRLIIQFGGIAVAVAALTVAAVKFLV